MSASSNETVVIKKYANRRLYNTATSTYVTLENLAQMVKEGTDFNVYDAKSNEDITRSVLTQIIVEEEGKSGPNNLLPISFLRKLIGFYGDNMQWLVPKYLEHSMQSLTKNQDQIRQYFQTAFGGMFPFGSTLEQMSKQNMQMFERTMRMFSPFGVPGSEGSENSSEAQASAPSPVPSPASSSSSSSPSSGSSSRSSRASKAAAQEEAEEDAFTPSIVSSSSRGGNGGVTNKVTPMPTPETSRAASSGNVSGEDVQNKIAALQRQLSDLAKNKA